MDELVVIFQQYQFEQGQKIHIADGKRNGDWLVVGIDDKKVMLRCPVSGREFSWDRFCYQVATRKQQWPMDDEDE